MAGTDPRTPIANDGEGIDFNDVNGIMKGASQRAWEWPNYGALQQDAQLADNFPTVWANAGGLRKAFTIGGGLQPRIVLGTQMAIGAGMLGIYDGTTPPVALTPAMKWIYMGDAEYTVTLATPAIGPRWDLVSVRIAESDAVSASRDFRDGTTGELSTQTMNTRRILTPTFTVTQGAESGGIPSLPAGEFALFAAKVDTGATITFIHDLTFPFSPCRIESPQPWACGMWDPSEWGMANAVGGTIAPYMTNLGGTKRIVFVPNCGRDGHARIIGVRLNYLCAAGTVDLVNTSLGGAALDVSSSFTFDGAHRQTVLDLRGDPFVPGGIAPFWGGGQHYKKSSVDNSDLFGLRFTSGATGNTKIYGIDWLYLKA